MRSRDGMCGLNVNSLRINRPIKATWFVRGSVGSRIRLSHESSRVSCTFQTERVRKNGNTFQRARRKSRKNDVAASR